MHSTLPRITYRHEHVLRQLPVVADCTNDRIRRVQIGRFYSQSREPLEHTVLRRHRHPHGRKESRGGKQQLPLMSAIESDRIQRNSIVQPAVEYPAAGSYRAPSLRVGLPGNADAWGEVQFILKVCLKFVS